MTTNDYIELLYKSLLGRRPDPGGLAHFAALLESTGDLKSIVDALVGSEEYARLHAPAAAPAVPGPDDRMDRPFVIVDVGAQKLADEDHVYAPLLNAGLDWRCIGFEPLKERREDRRQAEPDPNLVMIDAFVGDGRNHTFRVVNDDGSSSLLPLNVPFIRDYEHICTLKVVAEEEVETKTLDTLLGDEPFVDFLKFDIQGFESRALQGAAKTLARTNVVHTECFFGPMYLDQGFFADIDLTLRAAGFDFIDFSYLARYRYVEVPEPSKIGERLIWADAVYFRRLDPARDPPSCFQAQATVAERIYAKPGLAQQVRALGGIGPGRR